MQNSLIIGFFAFIFWFIPAGSNAQQPHFRRYAFPEEYGQVRIRQFLQSSNGFIWLGVSEGLFRFDGHRVSPVAMPEPNRPFSVRSLYEDRKGRLWVGLESGAIYFLDAARDRMQAWDPEEGHPAAPVVAFAEDPAGRLWIATYGEGLYCWKDGRLYNFSTEDGMGGDEIYDMDIDALGQVWCGTDRGINLVGWDGERKIVRHLGKAAGLPDEIVRVIRADDRCGVWVGMYDGGICRFDSESLQADYIVKDWSLGVVTALTCFHKKEIWIGTESNGLVRLDLPSGQLKRLSSSGASPGNRIYDLLRDDEGGIWVAGNTSGFFAANRQFEFVDNSPADIQAVLADRQERIWVGAQSGLYLKLQRSAYYWTFS